MRTRLFLFRFTQALIDAGWAFVIPAWDYNPHKGDAGGARLCSAVESKLYAMVKADRSMFRIANASPLARHNLHMSPQRASSLLRDAAGTVYNSTAKNVYTLMWEVANLGIKGGWNLDLCAGTGTASMAGAVLGVSSVAVDMDERAIQACSLRMSLYTDGQKLQQMMASYEKHADFFFGPTWWRILDKAYARHEDGGVPAVGGTSPFACFLADEDQYVDQAMDPHQQTMEQALLNSPVRPKPAAAATSSGLEAGDVPEVEGLERGDSSKSADPAAGMP
jgi:hypothetical protein